MATITTIKPRESVVIEKTSKDDDIKKCSNKIREFTMMRQKKNAFQ